MKLKLAVGGGVLLAALHLAAAAPAFAQKVSAGGNTRLAEPSKDPTVRYMTGVELLQQKDFQHAALAFRDVLELDQRNANANYMMAIAQIGLNDLVQARNYLRTAVRSNPKLVDARAKLGYIEAKLEDAVAARDQRAALGQLEKSCKGTCPDAAAIGSGITLIEKGLAEMAVGKTPAAAPG